MTAASNNKSTRATAPKKVHAFSSDVLASHDATALAALLRAKEISASEVLAASMARAQKMEPLINAIALPDFTAAQRVAEKLPAGFFAGVPIFIKDNTDVKNLPSNQGSLAVNARRAKTHSPVTEQIFAQGFISMGKSRLPEFGFNASTEYAQNEATRNPWHTDYSAGASSGGSAALVAAGVVPIAHANDGGGSIRIPAACCGLIGLKPSRGRTKDSPAARALPINIISEGVLTRSVRDTANFFAEAEKFYASKTLPAIGRVEGANKKRLKIALMVNSITGQATDDDTRNALYATAELLQRQGHEIITVPLPISPRFADDFSVYWGLMAFSVSMLGKRLMSPDFDAKKMDNLSVGLANLYKRNFYKTPAMLKRLKKVPQDYAQIFKSADVVLSPVLAHTTPLLGYLSPAQPFDELFERLRNYVSFTPLNNVAGGPAISLPTSATENGLPISLHFSAACGAERTLLELAFELEQLQPWREIHAAV